jgi:hypothetical protein
VVPTGHAARLFSSHLLCKRTQSRPVTPARYFSFSFSRLSRRLPRNLRPSRSPSRGPPARRAPGLNIQIFWIHFPDKKEPSLQYLIFVPVIYDALIRAHILFLHLPIAGFHIRLDKLKNNDAQNVSV